MCTYITQRLVAMHETCSAVLVTSPRCKQTQSLVSYWTLRYQQEGSPTLEHSTIHSLMNHPKYNFLANSHTDIVHVSDTLTTKTPPTCKTHNRYAIFLKVFHPDEMSSLFLKHFHPRACFNFQISTFSHWTEYVLQQ